MDKYCPDPHTLPTGLTKVQKASYYADAHLIWYYFVAIAVVAAISLLLFKIITERIDRKKEQSLKNSLS